MNYLVDLSLSHPIFFALLYIATMSQMLFGSMKWLLIQIRLACISQVTFVSTEPMPPEFSHTVEFGNVTYNLYSHSFLHFGQVTPIYITWFHLM